MMMAWIASGDVHAEQVVSNREIKAVLDQGRLSIASASDPDLEVAGVELPGGIGQAEESAVESPLWGPGRQLVIRHGDGLRKTTVTVYQGSPFVQIHSRLVAGKEAAIELVKADIATLELKVAGKPADLVTLGSGGMQPLENAQGSYNYSVLANRATGKGVVTGWLTTDRGVGVMVPEADATTGSCKLKAALDFGHYRVAPGAERDSDVLAIGFFADAREGLEVYGDALAKQYRIQLPPRPNVYCTWYHRSLTGSGASTEKLLAENARFAGEHLRPYGLDVMQIDDNWQDAFLPGVKPGDFKSLVGTKLTKGPIKIFTKHNEHFPAGMEAMAGTLKSQGFTPGIWFMPFAGDIYREQFPKEIFAKRRDGSPYDSGTWSGSPIDATSAAGEAFLRERFRTIREWGYRYYKIDGLHTGAPSDNIYVNRAYEGKPCFADVSIHDPDATFVECFRKGMKTLREEAPGTFILGCTITQNMLSMGGSFGLVDAMRVGPDNDSAKDGMWRSVIKGCSYAGNLWFLHNRVWYNDPDPIYVRPSCPLERARWMASWQAVSGALNTTSMQYEQLPPERLDLLKRTLPTHGLDARPVDILDRPMPVVWTVGNERVRILGLFNPSESKQTAVGTTMAKLGLDPKREFDVFEYWSNRDLGKMTGGIMRGLPAASCEVLAIRPSASHPQVISTSRHITQGLIEVESESWNADTRTLVGSSRVVAGDPYELRIVVPDGMEVEGAIAEGKPMTTSKDGRILRAVYSPASTGTEAWSIRFKI
jgi:hypothetical protein